MNLFVHDELVAGLIVSVLVFFPYYFVLRWKRTEFISSAGVLRFFVVWASMVTAEYFIFGPSSFVAIDTDSRNLAFLHYLARSHGGGMFSHEIAGGQDLAIILPGIQHLMPERMLLHFLDPWLVLFFHKLAIVTIAFAGAYLLARGLVDGVDRFAAVSAAAVFTVSHVYLGNYSLEFGTGFAAIPIAVYAAVACAERKNCVVWVVGAGIILAMAQPMKVFPAALVATIGALVISERRNLGKTAAAFTFYVVLSVLNWHETLYGIALLAGETSRGFGAATDASDVAATLIQTLELFSIDWFPHNLFISVLFFLSIVGLLARRDNLGYRAIGACLTFVAIFLLVKSFPWQWVGLPVINRIEHAYMWLAVPVLVVPIAAKAAAAVPMGSFGASASGWNRRAGALLAAALCLLTWSKILNAAWFVALGGQNTSFAFQELKNPRWKTEKDVRAITLFEVPPTDVTAAFYGIDSFDGAILLNPKQWNDYWASIRKLPPTGKRVATRATLDWRHWNGKAYAVADELRLDLLRIANVKYIISALPLEGEGLTPVVTATRDAWPKTQPGFFAGYGDYLKSRIRRIFDPGRLFVYALSDTLPRIFAATGIHAVDDETDIRRLHEIVAEMAPKYQAVIARRHLGAFKDAPNGKLVVRSFKTVANGYDVMVDAPEGGVLMVNNVYLPYWRATVSGRAATMVPANAVQMAIVVPAGANRVEIRYHRPSLSEKLATVFN